MQLEMKLAKKRSYLDKYVPVIGEALKELLDLKDVDERLINENLKNYLERSRKL